MSRSRLRELRQVVGLTQTQLAARAGVSRQLIGAVEAGRHLPRVDAAVALAGVLGVPVEDLFRDESGEPAIGVLGPPADGQAVRLARVGDRLVCIPAEPEGEAWSAADGVVRQGAVDLLDRPRPAAVVAGCDPAIGLISRLLQPDTGPGVLAVSATSAASVAALVDGRTHAAVVHGPAGQLPRPDHPVHRVEMARWQVGLAAAADLPTTWVADALDGRIPVVQRHSGAASQVAFERASTTQDGVPGPRAAGHLDAADWARRTGGVAVSIEPAAATFGLVFHPLEEHVAELWVAGEYLEVAGIRRFLDELTGRRLHQRLAAIGGYDLTRCGVEVAA
jgi:DNA-binding XRE family transcriptional regulator